MATEPRQIPVTPSSDAARRRLTTHGIMEMPAGYDAEVAELFRDLRAASNLSEADLAGRLGTRTEVVQALEQGALFALPPWPETCRVVNGYGALLHLDVRPLLRRIYAQLEAGIIELRPKPLPDVPTMTPPEPMDYGYGVARGAPQPPPQPPRSAPQQGYPSPPPNQWPGAPPSYSPQQPQPHPQHPQANRQPQARPPEAQPLRPQLQPQPRPLHPPQPAPAPQAAPAQSQAPIDASFLSEPEVEKPRRKSALLKWGLVALVIAIIGFGLWMALGSLPNAGTETSTSPDGPAPVLDADDPRSRKADRLPSQF